MSALTKAGLGEALNGAAPFTLFAPTDAAINSLQAGVLDSLLLDENKDKLAAILLSHVLDGSVTAASIRGMILPAQMKTKAGVKAIVDRNGDSIKVNAATVTEADVVADNGRIHVIDQFLVPLNDIAKSAATAGKFNTLLAALTAADLVDTLKSDGVFTVFAPTDDAFAKLPASLLAELLKPENKAFLTKVLKYHVSNTLVTASGIKRSSSSIDLTTLAGSTAKISQVGGVIKINDAATITLADVYSINGMIHAIDTVLMPPLDVVETALVDGNFKTLIAALTKADLLSTFKGVGPFTVFAPTDAAFAKIPTAVLMDLLKPSSKGKLANLIKYHVVGGKQIQSKDMKPPQNFTMLSNGIITLVRDGATLKIDGSTIIKTDIVTSNGVIHVVDTVLALKAALASNAHAYQVSFGAILSMLVFLYHACM